MSGVAWVAGGAGFVGSHLCDELLGFGMKVVCIDNLSTGSLLNLPMQNPRFSFWNWDVCHYAPPLNLSSPSVVFHLASPASPVAYMAHPQATIEANTTGTANLIRWANGARFVYASSSEVYGEPYDHPQSEDDFSRLEAFGNRAPYALAKALGEVITREYSNGAIARLFNCYGPRMGSRDGRCVPEFIRCALEGAPLRVHGNGEQTRSFCYVRETVSMLMRLGFSTRPHTVNIGNPEEITIGQLAWQINGLVKRGSAVVTGQWHRTGDPTRRKPSLARYLQHFPAPEFTTLETGLTETIAWFQENHPKEQS